MKTYEGNNQEHFEQPDDGKYQSEHRGLPYKSWRYHRYTLVSHHPCGFHMQRIGPCNGECHTGYGEPEKTGPREGCTEFICISERAVGRTFHLDWRALE